MPDAPKDLAKEYPHLKEFFPFLDAQNRETPRGRVLICSGYIEEQLRKIILAFMLDCAVSRNLLDGPNAPLGTFSSRIGACYALSLITEEEHHDLSLLRKIRNQFAHEIHPSFEDASTRSRCAALKLKAHDYVTKEGKEVLMTPDAQFVTAAVALILRFTNRAHYVERERRAAKEWPK